MAEAFLKVVLENLSSLIRKEIGLIMGVDKEMKKLSSTLTTIQAVLEDAEDKQIESRPIRDWLRKVNLLAYQIDDILDECNTHVSKLNHTHSKHSRYSLKKILYRSKIARRMKQVTEELDCVAAERVKFHLQEMPVDRPREVAAARETGSLLNESDKIYGRDEDRDKIVKMLVGDVRDKQEISVLPIIGVGGLGKTTLAQVVFNDPRVVEHFETRIWVCVSDNFEIKSLIKAMIESATGSGKASDLQHLDALERCLWELLSQKRYLLVLDDVWNDNQEKWFELKDILSCGSTGASIIVTTRQNKIAQIMGTLPTHCLKGLSDEQCWMLLKQRAFQPEEDVSTELEIIGKQIVKKCGGVPLAANALGGVLRFKRTQEEWVYVRESNLWKLSPADSLIVPALRLSYHHLPLELRHCFAYFAAFPKDYQVRKEELIRLWVAHGYISSAGKLQAEDVGNEICNELVLRSLLQPSEYDDMIRMHDLVHDLAQSVMENKVPGIQADITSVSTIHRQVNLLDRNVFFPQTFQRDMNISSVLEFTSLRVLNASDTRIKVLPSSIANLKHLRYLNLSFSEIHTLPKSLCTLWNLQVLNLDYCDRLVALPKNMRYLHNLEHLCLSSCISLSEMPSKIRELARLKTLGMFVVGFKRSNQLEELQCLNLGGRLEIRHLERVKDHMDAKKANLVEKRNLRHLSLSWKNPSKLEEDADEQVLGALEPHQDIESLRISGFSGRYFPLWMTNSTLGKVVEIEIENCQNCRRLPKLGELPHLKSLSLRNLAVEYIIDDDVENGNPVKKQFFALQNLSLSDLPNLKGLSNDQESKEAFSNLDTLCIVRCSLSIVPPLSSLQKLKLLECNSSTLSLFSENDTLTDLLVTLENMSCFPMEMLEKFINLKILTIHHARDMSVPGEGLHVLKRLQYLTIGNFMTMRSISEGLLRQLTALNSLTIASCRELVELPEEIIHLQHLEWIYLMDLPKMACLPEVLRNLSSLRHLSLISLPQLESVPGQLTSLHSLHVIDCVKVAALPALPNLKELCVSRCPQLERRYQRGTGQDWHKIAHIPRLQIDD